MLEKRILRALWIFSIIVMAAVILISSFFKELLPDINYYHGPLLFLAIACLAFFAEYVDSSLGMGYGTTLTPILMIAGYEPLEIVPAVLLSEFLSGITAGLLHHKSGNVNLGSGTRNRKIMLVLTSFAVAGTIIAVFLALNLPKQYVKIYIGLMIFAMGLIMLFRGSKGIRFSWGKIAFIGGVAAFNKGISGGGFGPLVTSGQIISGVPEKNAVGITSLVEGIVCLVGIILYLLNRNELNIALSGALVTGAILSIPAAVRTVKFLPKAVFRRAIGFATLGLGLLTLVKLL